LVHGICALQPGTQAPLLQTPSAQSLSEAQATHLPTPPETAQCGFALGQSVSSAHSTHSRNSWVKPPLTVAQAGAVAGQSAFVAHCAHRPIAQTLAFELLALGAGQSVLVWHGMPLPIGVCGCGPQMHCPHHCAAPQPVAGTACPGARHCVTPAVAGLRLLFGQSPAVWQPVGLPALPPELLPPEPPELAPLEPALPPACPPPPLCPPPLPPESLPPTPAIPAAAALDCASLAEPELVPQPAKSVLVAATSARPATERTR
jgi:hypothetical protein